MARPTKETVDYFPHFVKGGRTIFILESKYGNDGYAFWFKLLEILGDAEGHYYDCSISSNWEYLLAKTRVSAKKATEIIEVLISLRKIDAELWGKNRVIWIENFVNNLTEVYRTRHTELPKKPSFSGDNLQQKGVFSEKTPNKEGFSTRKPDKEKDSREKKRIYPYQDIVALWNEICGSCLPKVKSLNDDRRQKIKCRLDEFGGESKEDWLGHTKELFERVIASDFLRGDNNSGWTATFDWVFENAKNWVKVVEGNYDNNRGARNAQQQQRTRQGVTLGVGEYIEPQTGRRTYGTGKANIPKEAPPRPSERHSWDSASESWVFL